MNENRCTRAWQLYEEGRSYNSRLVPDQYRLVNTNTEFFIGNQWVNLPETSAMQNLPKPTFNILKRVASLFIASLTSSATALRFEPLAYYDGSSRADPDHDAAVFANAEVQNLWEKLKMDYRIRDALFDGAVTGDYCAHFYFDPTALPYGGAFGAYRGEIRMELVDGINVHFGNPNDRRVEQQPYILMVGRDTAAHLTEEARRHSKNAGEVRPDSENDRMTGIGGKTELSADNETGKSLYVLLYRKETKEVTRLTEEGELIRVPETHVYATKATRDVCIYEDVDTGLSHYPIAWGNWEKQANQYHGRALVTGLIPNQIFINTLFAKGMKHLDLMAFPKVVYNADLIPRWDNSVGTAIGVHGLQPDQSLTQAAYTVQPSEMSTQIFALIDKAMSYTKECLGATDAQMGNVRPDNTSALMVLQTNAEVPLENIRAGLYEWVEDIGRILLDMMGTYYGRRSVIVEREFEEPVTGAGGMPRLDPETGLMATERITRRTAEEFDFSVFKHLWLNLRADVGASTYFSEIAMTQTLDNLRSDGTLNVIQYLERIPDKLIPKKAELIEELKRRAGGAAAEEAPPRQDVRYAQGGALSEDKLLQGLTPATALRYESLPAAAKKAARLQGAQRIH